MTRRRPGATEVPDHTPEIAARGIDGHLLRTADTVTAWYRLPSRPWSFRAHPGREDEIRRAAETYADLQGRWLHLRVTTRPCPADEWAAAHAANNPPENRPADVPGAPTWTDYLAGEQAALAGRGMADKEVYLGVRVGARGPWDRLVDAAGPLLTRFAPRRADTELLALTEEVDRVDQLMAGPGFRARPVTAAEMRWLLHRSCALGLPAPTRPPGGAHQWSPADLAAVTDPAVWHQEPYAPAVTVTGRAGQSGQRRHVVILTVGTTGDQDIPAVHEPWTLPGDRLAGGVEWSGHLYIQTPAEVIGRLRLQAGRVRSQVRHYTAEHHLDAPPSLARQAARVAEIEDAVTHGGLTALSTRARSWWRVAVTGATEAEALAAAGRLTEIYRPKLQLEHPEAQYTMAREFIPGERVRTSAYERRSDVVWLAAAMPSAAAEVGDRRGVLLGETVTATRRPVAWDPWMAQEVRDSSGLTAVVAGLGAGKSWLVGGMIYKTVRAGGRWVVLDPSGPLAALCDLPDLRPHARAVDLLRAAPGTLNPFNLVADPHPHDHPDQRDYNLACKYASATRRRLVIDTVVGLLPHNLAHRAETRVAVSRAVTATGGGTDRHIGHLIDRLRGARSEATAARRVADVLAEAADRLTLLIPEDADPDQTLRLTIPPPGTGSDQGEHAADPRLTVLSLAGLVLPADGLPREEWDEAEVTAVTLLNLAAWLTQRRIYDLPRGSRKGVWIDEAFFLSKVGTGRALIDRFTRDSRKWNTRVILSSQIPADILAVHPSVAVLLDSAFVGRLDDDQARRDALKLLKVPTGTGYEEVIAGLGTRIVDRDQRDTEPRQFVFADGAGGIERVRIDYGAPHLAGLRAALNTTPTRHALTTGTPS